MVSGKKRMMLLMLTVPLMVLLLYVACEDSGREEIKFEGEDEEEELSRDCQETFDFLYDKCEMILYDAQGLPIDKEDAVVGCGMCQADNEKYPQYCCIFDCANTYRACSGMTDCTHSCLGSSGNDDDTADDDAVDDDMADDDSGA